MNDLREEILKQSDETFRKYMKENKQVHLEEIWHSAVSWCLEEVLKHASMSHTGQSCDGCIHIKGKTGSWMSTCRECKRNWSDSYETRN